MSKIYKNATELIGKTPLLQLTNYTKNRDLNADIIAKLEYFNPAGSVKDRIAFAMIQDAKDGASLIDATCGRRTRAVLITDSGHIILSAIQPETVANRFADKADAATAAVDPEDEEDE